jgi:hypothetical protein
MRITIIDKRRSQSSRQFGFIPLGWTNGFTRSARLVPINALRSPQYPGIRRHTRELTNSQINSELVSCRCDPRKKKKVTHPVSVKTFVRCAMTISIACEARCCSPVRRKSRLDTILPLAQALIGNPSFRDRLSCGSHHGHPFFSTSTGVSIVTGRSEVRTSLTHA